MRSIFAIRDLLLEFRMTQEAPQDFNSRRDVLGVLHSSIGSPDQLQYASEGRLCEPNSLPFVGVHPLNHHNRSALSNQLCAVAGGQPTIRH